MRALPCGDPLGPSPLARSLDPCSLRRVRPRQRLAAAAAAGSLEEAFRASDVHHSGAIDLRECRTLIQRFHPDLDELKATQLIEASSAAFVAYSSLLLTLKEQGLDVSGNQGDEDDSDNDGLSVGKGLSENSRSQVLQAAGHDKSVVTDEEDSHFILKPYNEVEARVYETIWAASAEPLQRYVGLFGGVIEVETAGQRRKFMRISNLLKDAEDPCVMDCKLGTRTFKESEVASQKPRADLYKQLEKLAPERITEEERASASCTKYTWMVTRDSISSSARLGFRIDGISSREGVRVHPMALHRLREDREIVPMLLRVLPPRRRSDPDGTARRRLAFTKDIVAELTELTARLQDSSFFKSHEIIGASVLFVVDKMRVRVHLIDFAKTEPLPEGVKVDHRQPWKPGNREDGVLLGVDSLLRLWTQALCALQSETGSDLLVDRTLQEEVDKLGHLLQKYSVNTSLFRSRGLEELVWELQAEQSVSLELDGRGRMRRSVDVVKVWILVDIPPGEDENQSSLASSIGHGSTRVLMAEVQRRPLARKMGAGESWQVALKRAISELLGISPDKQSTHFDVLAGTYMYSCEEKLGNKHGYTGLYSVYHIHEVDVRIVDPAHPDLSFMGLPACEPFRTVMDYNMLLGSEVRRWGWAYPSDLGHALRGTVAGFPHGINPAGTVAVPLPECA